MKKNLVFLIALLLLPIAVVFSQGDTIVVPPVVDVPIPDDFFDAINLQKWLLTLTAMVGVITFFATIVNGLLKTDKSWIRKAVAWVIAVLLAVAGKIFGIGFIAEITWIMVVVTAALAGLGANGMFDVPGLQSAWYLIESLLGSVFAKKKLNE